MKPNRQRIRKVASRLGVNTKHALKIMAAAGGKKSGRTRRGKPGGASQGELL